MKKVTIAVIAAVFTLGFLQASEAASNKKKESAKDAYPLKTCVVSGETLGEMGDAYIYKHKGQEIRFCCKGCKKDFLKEPEKYMAKLKKAKAGKTMKAKGHDEHGSHKAVESDKGAQSEGDHGGHDQHSGHGH